ncbi:MAG: NosD domain-containing protein, partial [Candidatus Thorarchaeota archaeon]
MDKISKFILLIMIINVSFFSKNLNFYDEKNKITFNQQTSTPKKYAIQKGIYETGHSFVLENSLNIHDPIYINNNTDLIAQASNEGWQGNGSESNPYIIQNYFINYASSHGVYLNNITFHTMIKNIWVNDSVNNGFYFYNSNNITIMNNTASFNNFGYCIGDQYSNEVINNSLINNYAFDNDKGFVFYHMRYNDISNNTALNNKDGFYFTYFGYNNLTNNIVTQNDYGIFCAGSSTTGNCFENEIKNNFVSKNHISGITLGFGLNNLLENNLFFDNSISVSGSSGLSESRDNQVINNRFENGGLTMSGSLYNK